MNAPGIIYPRLARILCPLLTLALLVPAAGAAPPVPPTLTGEWYSGYVYPRATYAFGSDAFKGATSSARRLVLRPDGTYELTTLKRSTTLGYFGMSTSMISCEQISVNWERGTFAVRGGTLTLKAAVSKGVNAATPNEVNRGCTRFAGIRYDGKNPASMAYAWKVTGTTLAVTARDASLEYRRARPEELARANTPPAPPSPPTPAPAAETPRPSAPAPVQAGATGKWVGRFTADDGTPLDVRLSLDDDRNGIQGVVYSAEDRYIGTVQGDAGAGRLTLTLNLPDDTTLELRAEGRFVGNDYSGRFQAISGGQPVGGGKLTLERQPGPIQRR